MYKTNQATHIHAEIYFNLIGLKSLILNKGSRAAVVLPLKCPRCDKNFTENSNLKVHIQKMHDIDEHKDLTGGEIESP